MVDICQGLDIRLTTPDNVALLNKVRTKAVHFAWDDPNTDLTPYFRRFVELTNIKSDRRRRVYVLTNFGSTHEQDLYRVDTLRGLGYDPYVMVYERPTAPKITRQLQRWVNNKRIFHTVDRFDDYIHSNVKKEAWYFWHMSPYPRTWPAWKRRSCSTSPSASSFVLVLECWSERRCSSFSCGPWGAAPPPCAWCWWCCPFSFWACMRKTASPWRRWPETSSGPASSGPVSGPTGRITSMPCWSGRINWIRR